MIDLFVFDEEPFKLCKLEVTRGRVVPKSTYKDRNDTSEKIKEKKFTKEEWENFVSFITQNEHKEIK